MDVFFALAIHFLSVLLNFHTGSDQEKKIAQRTEAEADDTAYIQQLIDNAHPGDTVVLTGRTYHVRSLKLRSGVSIYSSGVLKQIRPDSVADFTMSKQYSPYPLFHGSKVKGISLTFKASTYGEALYLDHAEDITIRAVAATGDSTKLQSFSGFYLFESKGIDISHVELAHYGVTRKSPHYYQRGTGIRLQTCRDVRIAGSHIHHNGENGIFSHSSTGIHIEQNRIHHNGMSGIQVAFGSIGMERDYKIINNLIFSNAADAIDINNPSLDRRVDLAALIAGNKSFDNGWVKGEKTPDGSGIATLVGLKNVEIRNNRSSRSNRPAVYLRDCDSIEIINNQSDNFAEIVGSQGSVRLYKNTFSGLRLLADLKAEKLLLDSNHIPYLAIPNGIIVDSLIFRANELRGNINVNMQGQLIFKDNTLHSSSPYGAMILRKVNGARLSRNRISTSQSDALCVHDEAANVVIEANKIRSPAACIKDSGSSRLKIIKNSLSSDTSGGSPATAVILSRPKDLTLSNNTYYLGDHPIDNTEIRSFIGLEGEGTVFINGKSRKL
jgi:Nitrous oxidase accessory protein